jgi:hypothetical protein
VSNLTLTHPELAMQWHPTKNGSLTSNDVTFGSNRRIWWKCPVSGDHEWEAPVDKRTGGTGCPCCDGKKVVLSNCLMTTHLEISAQWHPTKNGSLTPNDVTFGRHKSVWWKCPVADDHEWEAAINSRTTNIRRGRGNGCPCCAGLKAVLSNCLVTTHPELVLQWHSTKNGSLTPYDVTFGSEKKVWWQCPVVADHEWAAIPCNRGNGDGCPCCRGLTVVLSNCLATTHPELAAQWHPMNNGSLTPNDVTSGSNKKVWWLCSMDEDHEWEAMVNSRKSGCGCPYCNESHGEKVIDSILFHRGDRFERQVRFDDCKYLRHLPFDFLVRLPNGEPVLIEYHGEQHYKPGHWGSSKTDEERIIRLEKIQKRDQIKEQYARDNGVPLLVIPYWDIDKIEILIEDFIISNQGEVCA